MAPGMTPNPRLLVIYVSYLLVQGEYINRRNARKTPPARQ